LFRAQIPRTPKLERPRERLLALGAAALRTAELLAILVRSGLAGESALQAGERIAAHYTNRLEKLVHAGRGELKEISRSVGETAYCQIMAGIELGRRVEEARSKSDTPDTIRGSEDARDFCATRFARLAIDGAQEEFHIVTLDTKNHVIDTHQVSRGVLDQAIVQPREVFRPAIKDSAKAIILVHNHPSGDPRPSDQDRTLTTRLEEAGRVLGIQVLDHIIVGRLGTLSMQEYQEG
jgi:DNA repair protein RadC